MGNERTPQPPATAAAPHRPAAQGASLAGTAHRWLLDRIGALWALLTDRPVSLYAASVLRIGYGLLYLLFLLREFPHRDEIWGPGSPWTPALAHQLFDQTGWNSVLILSDSRAYFELCYVTALLTSALFMLGWRTRAMSVLFAVVVTSFHARSIFMTDGGDNLILLMALYLVLTACGRRWSLDARRNRLRTARADGAPEPARSVYAQQLLDARTTLTTVVHNCGILVIAAQVCFLYGSAGLYKIQGPTWGGGTALHYALNLELFQPWPALSHLVDTYPMVIAIAGYVTVLVQVAFPFVLFGRLKYPVLTVLLGMHVGIAVLLGLPLFSGAMIVADAVFLPDRFYAFLPLLWRRAAQRTGMRRPAPGRAAEFGSVPAQGGPGAPGPSSRAAASGTGVTRVPHFAGEMMRTTTARASVIREESVPHASRGVAVMGGTQGKPKEPGKGSEAQEHHRSGDPAHPQPGRSSREQGHKQGQKEGQKETSRRREDDLLREEDLHDENL